MAKDIISKFLFENINEYSMNYPQGKTFAELLADMDSEIIKEGIIYIPSKYNQKKWKQKIFRLAKGYIYYFNFKDPNTIRKIYLEYIENILVTESDLKQFIFRIVTQSKQYICKCNSATDLKHWIDCIENAVNNAKELKIEENSLLIQIK